MSQQLVATAAQTTVYTAEHTLRHALDRLVGQMRRVALYFTEGDEDRADDLLQVAWMRLWELDPSRFDEREQAYVREVLVAKMINALRDARIQEREDLRVDTEF
jgi:DNA-directed RNA polymerase specialized sigma24 family protein